MVKTKKTGQGYLLWLCLKRPTAIYYEASPTSKPRAKSSTIDGKVNKSVENMFFYPWVVLLRFVVFQFRNTNWELRFLWNTVCDQYWVSKFGLGFCQHNSVEVNFITLIGNTLKEYSSMVNLASKFHSVLKFIQGRENKVSLHFRWGQWKLRVWKYISWFQVDCEKVHILISRLITVMCGDRSWN